MPKVGKPAAKKKQNGYKMPDPLPQGEILEDIFKKKWKLGTSIGKGGFGEIYSAQELASTSKTNTYPYVIKIEPHNNGPLFVEMHFFMRNAKKSDIDTFISSKKLTSLGMPVYCGSGSHDFKNEKYRFVVMERFGSDIWKVFLENKRVFSPGTVYKIGIQILDVLEYIHSKGYVHADIKGANILLDLKNKNQVYLVDFGLATHYFTGGKFKPNPKKAHDGTIEYLSRDAHLGVQTRRGDLEILIYNLIQWLGCTLPWEKDIKDPVTVQKSKEKHMDDILLFMKTCFGNNKAPDIILNLLIYLKTLDFNTDIDYKKIRKILEKGLNSAGASLQSPYKFKTIQTPKKSPVKRKSNTETPLSGKKKKKLSRRKLWDNCTEDDDSDEKEKDNDSDEVEVEQSPQKVKQDTPKKRVRKPKVEKKVEELDNHADESNDEDNKGYTAEMKRVLEKMKASKQPKGRSRVKKRAESVGDLNEVMSPSNGSTDAVRGKRNRKKVNYNENQSSKRSISEENWITNSDQE